MKELADVDPFQSSTTVQNSNKTSAKPLVYSLESFPAVNIRM